MTKKQFSVWMLAGCIGAGSTIGVAVSAEQMDGEMGYYNSENEYDTVPSDVYVSYDERLQEPQAPQPDTWVPDYTESYDSTAETYDSSYSMTENYDVAETYSEDTTPDSSEEETESTKRYYKDDEYIGIRKTEGEKFIEDFDILTKEDAERDFDLLAYEDLPSAVSLNVPEVRQLPELPTGCESVALTMALEYEGFMLYKTTIAREFLIYNQETDNMAVGYIGDPFSEDGAGCFAPAIAATADNFFEDQEADYVAYDISGSELEELLSYIEADTPVVLWTTMYMAEPEFTEDTAEYEGKTYRWYYQEHCVVLSGYDLDNHTLQINDPLEGIVTRDYDEFKQIYDTVGKYAVVVKKNAEEKEE